MNTRLAPTHQKLFGEFWVLWYAISNSYSIIDIPFKNLLDCYLQSNTYDDFITKAYIDNPSSNPKTLIETLHNYLKDCNKPSILSKDNNIDIDISNRYILKQYLIKGKSFQIFFDSELVLKTIHPSLAHLTTELNDYAETTFDIYLKNEHLYLFKDSQLITHVPKRDYHLIQGKFIMQLLCFIHDKKEDDWIGTFHGSTITDGNSAILFIGESGKGKSTLSALLSNNGFNLLADDVSPMLSKNRNIYFNPSAISIKKGAFNILQPIVTNFDSLPIVQFNKTKGSIKYIPSDIPKKDSYPCNAIILVNYVPKSKISLENLPIKILLETLIPDSWLSPNPYHAKQFLDWLKTLKIYKLTYSDTKSVIEEVSELFKHLNKNLYC